MTVRDGEGSMIGAGSITDSFMTVKNPADRQCAFRFRVEGLPRSDFYSIQVATREPVTYSFDQLAPVGWIVPITL